MSKLAASVSVFGPVRKWGLAERPQRQEAPYPVDTLTRLQQFEEDQRICEMVRERT